MSAELEKYVFKTGRGRHPQLTKLKVGQCRVRGTKRRSGKTKIGISGERVFEEGVFPPKQLTFSPKTDFSQLTEYALYYVTSTETTQYDYGQREVYKRYHIIVKSNESFYTIEYHNFVRNEKLAHEMLNRVNEGKITGFDALSLMFL